MQEPVQVVCPSPGRSPTGATRLEGTALAYGGLRWAEPAGLRWRRCVLLHGRIEVAEAASYDNGRLLYGSPKVCQLPIAADANPVVVQRHLGHKDVTTTLNNRAGPFPKRLDEIVVALDETHAVVGSPGGASTIRREPDSSLFGCRAGEVIEVESLRPPVPIDRVLVSAHDLCGYLPNGSVGLAECDPGIYELVP